MMRCYFDPERHHVATRAGGTIRECDCGAWHVHPKIEPTWESPEAAVRAIDRDLWQRADREADRQAEAARFADAFPEVRYGD